MQNTQVLRAGLTDNELNCELSILNLFQPNTIVEIGSADGGHISHISPILKNRKSKIMSIDPWDDQKRYKEYSKNIGVLRNSFKNICYVPIKGKSQSPKVIAELKRNLSPPNTGIDYLFIDGAHDKDSVMTDWENYKKLVNRKGIVCFHDVIAYEGVASTWKEIVRQLDLIYSSRVIDLGGRFLLTGQENVHLGLGFVYNKNLDRDLLKLIESF